MGESHHATGTCLRGKEKGRLGASNKKRREAFGKRQNTKISQAEGRKERTFNLGKKKRRGERLKQTPPQERGKIRFLKQKKDAIFPPCFVGKEIRALFLPRTKKIGRKSPSGGKEGKIGGFPLDKRE